MKVDQEVGRVTTAGTPDVDDFTEWVKSRAARLQRFAYLITGSANDAPDLVQEALLRAFPRWASLIREGTADAYVRRIIVNQSITNWRKRRPVMSVAPEQLDSGFWAPAAGDPAAANLDMDGAWRLCLELPPAQRAAVVLRFYEDRTFAQIAVILRCAEPTARSHVHRALATMRNRLGESDATGD